MMLKILLDFMRILLLPPCKNSALPMMFGLILELFYRYMNYLLGIPSISGSVVRGPSVPLVVLGAKEMENAVAEIAAIFLWLGMQMIRFLQGSC